MNIFQQELSQPWASIPDDTTGCVAIYRKKKSFEHSLINIPQ